MYLGKSGSGKSHHCWNDPAYQQSGYKYPVQQNGKVYFDGYGGKVLSGLTSLGEASFPSTYSSASQTSMRPESRPREEASASSGCARSSSPRPSSPKTGGQSPENVKRYHLSFVHFLPKQMYFFTLAINTISSVFRLRALYSSNHFLCFIALILVHTLPSASPTTHNHLYVLYHSLLLYWKGYSDSSLLDFVLSTNNNRECIIVTTILSSRTNLITHIIYRLFTSSFSSSLQHAFRTADLHHAQGHLVTVLLERIAVESHRSTEQHE